MNYISDFLLHTLLHTPFLPLSPSLFLLLIPLSSPSLSISSRTAQSAASLLQSSTWRCTSSTASHIHLGAHFRGCGRGRQHAQSPAGLESQCCSCCRCCCCCGSGLLCFVVVLFVGNWSWRSVIDAAHEGTEFGTHLCGLWRH